MQTGAEQFPIYWNMPAHTCTQHGFNFTSLRWKFVKNSKNDFQGDKISIFYNPGSFPRIHVNKNGELVVRNNGLPQAGNLTLHLAMLRTQIDRLIPDLKNKGLAILDMEDWYPRWKLNTDSKDIYRKQSRELVRRNNPSYKAWEVEEKAVETFHEHAEKFLVDTIRLAKRQRPNAVWGYYEYPYCDNYVLNKEQTRMPCSPDVKVENEKYLYVYKEVDALYPYIYLYKKYNVNVRAKHITGRIEEAYRLLRKLNVSKPVYPYACAQLIGEDTLTYLSKEDLMSLLIIPKVCGTDGVVMWGASNWFNSVQKCAKFNDYLKNIMGPVVDFVASCTMEEAKQWLIKRGERANICTGI